MANVTHEKMTFGSVSKDRGVVAVGAGSIPIGRDPRCILIFNTPTDVRVESRPAPLHFNDFEKLGLQLMSEIVGGVGRVVIVLPEKLFDWLLDRASNPFIDRMKPYPLPEEPQFVLRGLSPYESAKATLVRSLAVMAARCPELLEKEYLPDVDLEKVTYSFRPTDDEHGLSRALSKVEEKPNMVRDVLMEHIDIIQREGMMREGERDELVVKKIVEDWAALIAREDVDAEKLRALQARHKKESDRVMADLQATVRIIEEAMVCDNGPGGELAELRRENDRLRREVYALRNPYPGAVVEVPIQEQWGEDV